MGRHCPRGLAPLTLACLLRHSVGSATDTCRDQNVWPFAATSVWNTAVGSDAIFVPAEIFATVTPLGFFGDDDYFLTTSNSDPLTPWYNQGWWGPPSGEAHCNITGPLVNYTHFPNDVVVTAFGNNNAAAILQPDNRTLWQTQPLYRCSPGSPILSLRCGHEGCITDIQGNGTWGAHGGSSLSSIGGTIRLGELLPTHGPIRHALKLELFAKDYYFSKPPGFVWPALNCDGYAFDPSSPLAYGGSNPFLSPGALLAIPANVSVNVTTAPGAQLLWTLQNYGGYLVDDTAWNRGTFCVEHGVEEEFQAAYGYAFDASSGPFFNDLLRLFQALHIVVNNGPNTVGGGGNPRQPPPPPFCA